MAEITIIIPAYNAEKTLRKCLTSIKNQDSEDYEVIVVDDASKDATTKIVKGFNYTLLRLEKNSGQGRARNIGAQNAKTKFLAFTDSDCILPKDWLSKIMNNFKNKEIQFVCGGYSSSAGTSFLEKHSLYELFIRRKNLSTYVSSFPSNNFACYKDLFLKEKGFPEIKNYVAEDLEFSLNIGRKYKVLWDKDLGIKHHFHTKLKNYTKQQYKFARDTICLYIRKPYLKKIKTYQEDKNKFIIFYTGITGLNIILAFIYPKFIYLLPFLLIILFLLDFNFLRYVYKKEGLIFSLKSLTTLLLRNIFWTLGMLRGLFKFFV